jgi:uncharacterized membrane protein YgcG
MTSLGAFIVVSASAFPAGSNDTTPIVRNTNGFVSAFCIDWKTLTGFALVFLVSVLWLRWRVQGKAADEQYGGLTPGVAPAEGDVRPIVKRDTDLPISVLFEPPQGLRPGYLGTLIDERADVRDVTATIVDLAVRGYLRIEEVVEEGKKRKKNPDYQLVKLKDADDTFAGYETNLFNTLFSVGSLLFPVGEEVRLGTARSRFASSFVKMQSQLYEDVTTLGWFRGNPKTVRTRWANSGRLITAVGVGLTIALAVTSTWALVPLAIVLVGVMTMLTAKVAPVRTAEGTRILAQTQGFERFLATAEGNQLRHDEGQDIFSLYLPYAIAFGVADKWTETFAKLAKNDIKLIEPTWYVGSSAKFWTNSGSLTQRISWFGDLARITMSSPPHIDWSLASSDGAGYVGGVTTGGGLATGGGSASGGGSALALRLAVALLGGAVGGGGLGRHGFSGGGRFGGGGGGW